MEIYNFLLTWFIGLVLFLFLLWLFKQDEVSDVTCSTCHKDKSECDCVLDARMDIFCPCCKVIRSCKLRDGICLACGNFAWSSKEKHQRRIKAILRKHSRQLSQPKVIRKPLIEVSIMDVFGIIFAWILLLKFNKK